MKNNNITGIYRFYLGDELVSEQHNALTVAGRSIALKSLLGIIPGFAGYIAYGVGDSPNSYTSVSSLISNNTLDFEIGRAAVTGSSLRINNNVDTLVYSGVIDTPETFVIREVGLFPQSIKDADIGIYGSTVFNFNSVDVFSRSGTASGSVLVGNEAARIGTDFMYIPETSTSNDYLQYISTSDRLDYINKYSSQDNFRLAGYNIAESSASVVFQFFVDNSNYFEFIFPTPSASGYFVSKVNKGDGVLNGIPAWENVSYIRFFHNSASGLYLDGLRIDTGSYYISSVNGMISRAVLPSSVRKPPSIPMTIEYSLNVGFNQIGNVSWPT